EGRAALVTVGYGKGKAITNGPIRTEAVLDRERLDRLAEVLRGQKLWELADLSQADVPNPDEGEIRPSGGVGHGSLVGSCSDRWVKGQPKLLALKTEMAKVMAVVREEAAAKVARPEDLKTSDPTIATELARFEGTWVLVSSERNGRATSEEK